MHINPALKSFSDALSDALRVAITHTFMSAEKPFNYRKEIFVPCEKIHHLQAEMYCTKLMRRGVELMGELAKVPFNHQFDDERNKSIYAMGGIQITIEYRDELRGMVVEFRDCTHIHKAVADEATQAIAKAMAL